MATHLYRITLTTPVKLHSQELTNLAARLYETQSLVSMEEYLYQEFLDACAGKFVVFNHVDYGECGFCTEVPSILFTAVAGNYNRQLRLASEDMVKSYVLGDWQGYAGFFERFFGKEFRGIEEKGQHLIINLQSTQKFTTNVVLKTCTTPVLNYPIDFL